jgi:CheY-like chemotaxis protein
MNQSLKTALIVDDEPLNRRILERLLDESGFRTVSCADGLEAWEYLQAHPKEPNIILLDRMMPRMDGMELLTKIKEHDHLRTIPVIMQTAAGAPQQIIEGIGAGVFYYLIKPFEEEVLLSIVHSALEHATEEYALREETKKNKLVIGLITLCQFKLNLIKEAYNLSYFIANLCPNPEQVVGSLYALILNAHEHGNLNIGYKEKAKLKAEGTWQKEVQRRERLPENQHKVVEVRFGHDDKEIKIYIRDEGDGFDWRPYTQLDPARLTSNTGRGIALAIRQGFDQVEYLGRGNEVLCTIALR